MRQIVAADIGGTHARFALAEIDAGRVAALGEPVTLKTAEHSSFQLAWHEFGRRAGIDLPNELAIAFAGPAGGEVLKLTNNPWVIRPALMKERLDVDRYTIVNDFGAVAYAVATLGDEHFRHLCGPDRPLPSQGVISIVGPGTGLGVGVVTTETVGTAVGIGTAAGTGFAILPSATADQRIIVTAAEHRLITAAAEHRTITTAVESRTIVAVAEDREIETSEGSVLLEAA